MISIFNGRSRSLGSQAKADIHVQVSTELRKHLHLFKGAKFSIFMAIALHSDQHGWSRPSTRALRRETGYNADTIFKALAELCELAIGGHRVLLRKPNRAGDGTFGTNHYLIFPTPEEVSRYEPLDLFPGGESSGFSVSTTTDGVTVSEKPDTVITRPGESPTRKKTASGKHRIGEFRQQEVDPDQREEGFGSLFSGSLQSHQKPTHTRAPGAGTRCCVCEFEILPRRNSRVCLAIPQ